MHTLTPLEPRRLFAGVTLLTHGYIPLSGDQPGWVDSMKDAIVDRLGPDTAVFQLTLNQSWTGDLYTESFKRLTPHKPASNSSAESVLMLDWAATSGRGSYYESTTTLAQHVFPYLTGLFPALGITRPFAELPIHLVGHSRGGSLISELSRYLGRAGIWVDHQTTLDPHPVQDLYPDDADVRTYSNVLFADNYFRTGDGGPDGNFVPGAHNVDLNDIVTGDPFTITAHSGVHSFYHGTIDPAVTTDQDDDDPITINPAWYTHPGTGPRASIGYAWSRAIGIARPANGTLGTAARINLPPTAAGATRWDNVTLTSPATSSAPRGTPIQVSIRFADTNKDATNTLGLDTDTNPYNGIKSATSFKTRSTGKSTATLSRAVNTTTLKPGTYHVYAKITNQTHTRYDVLNTTVTLTGATDPAPTNAPDLTPRFLSTPATLPAQSKSNLTTLRITNVGNRAIINTPVTLHLYASTDATYDLTDTLLLSVKRKLTLAPNRFSDLTLTFPTPPSLPPGQYRLLATLDPANTLPERSDSNNTTSAKAPTRIPSAGSR